MLEIGTCRAACGSSSTVNATVSNSFMVIGGSQTNNWEDGGTSDFLDFVFQLTCTTANTASGEVRLTN